MGRWIVLFGIFLIAAGFTLHFHLEVPWFMEWIGDLPGDLTIKKGSLIIYIPLATSLLASVSLSLVLSLLFKPSK